MRRRNVRTLAVREGIFCGVSSGSTVAGALRVAKANPGAVVVAIIVDRGDHLHRGVCEAALQPDSKKIIAQAPFYPSARLAHVKKAVRSHRSYRGSRSTASR